MAADSSSSSTPMEENPSGSSSTSTATNGVGPSSSVSASTTKEEVLKVALNHLVQGKRHLLIKDVAAAIVALGESCQMLSEANGPLCSDNAEAHFYYGKALLEQSRLDLGVFEAAPSTEKESSEGEDEDEEDEEQEESDEAPQNEDGNDESNEAEAEPQQSEVKVDTSETKKEEDLNIPSPTTNTVEQVEDSEKPSTSSGANGEIEKEAEEELSNLELAWEVLEVAKIGYSSQIDLMINQVNDTKVEDEQEKLKKSVTNLQIRLAETHSLLGEVATESENYSQAVEDFKTGIKILSEIEGPDSREVAQYYFQMGLAYSFGKKFDDAVASFKTSKDTIQRRIANLVLKIESKQTTKDLGKELEDPNCPEHVEVEELKALIPELEEKINDTIDAERENKATIEEEVKEREIILKSSPIKNPNPPAANDISHLVKKKKKAEDVPSDAPPAKRICNATDAPKKDEVSSSNGHTVTP